MVWCYFWTKKRKRKKRLVFDEINVWGKNSNNNFLKCIYTDAFDSFSWIESVVEFSLRTKTITRPFDGYIDNMRRIKRMSKTGYLNVWCPSELIENQNESEIEHCKVFGFYWNNTRINCKRATELRKIFMNYIDSDIKNWKFFVINTHKGAW